MVRVQTVGFTKEGRAMNSFELIPTEENLIHTLNKDLLKRKINI